MSVSGIKGLQINLEHMTTSTMKATTQLTEVQKVWLTLKLTYGIVPIVAGLDKFTNILTDWTQYLSPGIVQALPFSASTFMMIVGVIEIVAGLIVLFKTELGAYIVSAWLVCIALTLIASWQFVDVAIRDVVMAIGAYSLARLTKGKHETT
jgi:uncharacterized membrane protein YphA (DoxX/SURF4 family)